jgi:hypothetical protein
VNSNPLPLDPLPPRCRGGALWALWYPGRVVAQQADTQQAS